MWDLVISSIWALKVVHRIPSSVAPWSFARRVAKNIKKTLSPKTCSQNVIGTQTLYNLYKP